MEFFVFLLGLAVGSFLNVLIFRSVRDESIQGRSRCTTCERKLLWFELIPLLSFCILRGKCRTCRLPISLQYPLVELTTALLFLFVWYVHSGAVLFVPTLSRILDGIGTIRDLLFASVLLVLFVQDLRFGVIVDAIIFPALLGTLVIDLFSPVSFLSFLGAALLASGFFFLQWVISRGRWIGSGDIRLGALLGLIVGWPLVLVVLVLAYVSGAIVGIALLLTGAKQWKSTLPFGTFLTLATFVTMFWGSQLIDWYRGIIGL